MKLRELEGFGLFLWPATALLAGLAAWALGKGAWADTLWLIGTGPILVVLILTLIRSLAKGQFGLDIIAAFSMAGAEKSKASTLKPCSASQTPLRPSPSAKAKATPCPRREA